MGMKKIILLLLLSLSLPVSADASYHFNSFKATPPIHVLSSSTNRPSGLSPQTVKSMYNLPATGGNGTIAIITAYHDPMIERDLAVFSSYFQITPCTSSNGCFEEHKISSTSTANLGWALETSLDVEWAHAIAPNAHILLVETTSPSGANLLKAVDYARSRSDVVSISMSWGGLEFPEETSLDSHFVSNSGAVFFAASGDLGAGVNWPSVSPNVTAVGGTHLDIDNAHRLVQESAWSGSGGGVSAYEPQPQYQKSYNIPRALGMRSIPDVSYNADPKSGYSVYRSTSRSSGKWYTLGGTSAGSPQWAAIHSLGLSVSNQKLYADKDKENNKDYFRDITSGANGTCTYYCQARARYDYVTGLGSPLTTQF
jgi:subtilase family serine protease